jgi:hypothetical protein
MKTAKLCKLYRAERFIGFGLAIDDELISNLVSTTLTTEPDGLNAISATFTLHNDDTEKPIIIRVGK